MTIGVWVDERRPRLDHPPQLGDAEQQRARRRAQSADRRVLPRRAAGAGVRPGRQPRAALGRPGPGLRVARVEPRHLRRPQGQRLDRRQRRQGRAHPEVHQGRQVPAAGRRALGEQRQAATTSRTSGASPRSSSTRRPTRPIVADGYGNQRVAVLDADTGKMKRYWGAYGNRPDGRRPRPPTTRTRRPAQQFRNPVHCADVSNDGLVYVCDRQDDRLQVFTPDGTFVKEQCVRAQARLGDGSVWDIAFSKDPQQTLHLHRRRQQREGAHHRCARRSRS